MIQEHGHFRVQEQLTTTIADIAAIYLPKTAIDPCCENVAILEKCTFSQERRAIFRNPSALREAEAKKTAISCELGDITRFSLGAVYDLVVTVVPFGSRDLIDGRTRNLDVVVAERSIDLIAVGGVGILIVPHAFLIAQRLSAFRRLLRKLAIDAVIEIPPGGLFESVGIPSAIIVVRRGTKRPSVFMGEYQPDHGSTVAKTLREGVGDFFVASGEMSDRWTRSFHDPKQRAVRSELDSIGAKPLGDFGEIRMGSFTVRDKYRDNGEYLVLTGRHLRRSPIKASEGDRFVNRTDEEWFAKCVVEPGDVVFSLINPSAYVYKMTDPPAIVGNNVAVLRTHDNEYVSTYLNTPDGQQLFEHQANSVGSSMSGLVYVSVSELRQIRIPVLPIEELNAVSDAAIATASIHELEDKRLFLERLNNKLKHAEAALGPVSPILEDSIPAETDATHHDEMLKRLTFIDIQLKKILDSQQIANAKLDQIVNALTAMRGGIDEIKQGSRNAEEKLTRICAKLDAFTEASASEVRTIQEYVDVVQTWFDRWELLHALTQKFLPSAEQIYDLLEKQKGADYSPFVLQYCRALENEILTKLFCAYHDDIRKRIPDLRSFVVSDLSADQTERFAKSVRDDKRKYTLGDMNFIMQLMKSGSKTLKLSQLLQDFRAFVISYFNERIAEKEFLERLKGINEDFRCKAAHPYLMTKEEADKCLLAIREQLCELLDAYRSSSTSGT